MALIECVPNFSEGRRPEVIAEIADAIASVDGVQLLNGSTDADHNRTVMTFAGEIDGIAEATFRGIAKAAERIDLDHHQGVHPRTGAADVVPFIPLRDATMQDCIALAHRVGERVGRELGLPVYLYEQAATRPERRNLADVRRPRYEGLKDIIANDPLWTPDYGPVSLTPAGAVIIGAREPLIAFNAFLDTDDVQVAEAVALSIRASGGGLPYLKALGLLVRGQAQVSMNVIDFRQTGLYDIISAVRQAAAAHGHHVTHTEIVGLVPEQALIDAALGVLGLPAVARELILERRVGALTGDYRQILFGRPE